MYRFYCKAKPAHSGPAQESSPGGVKGSSTIDSASLCQVLLRLLEQPLLSTVTDNRNETSDGARLNYYSSSNDS